MGKHVNHKQAVRSNVPNSAAHEHEVARRKACPVARDASWNTALANDLARLVSRAGHAAGRSQPYFVDRLILLQRILKPRGDILVDLALRPKNAMAVRII